MSSSRRTVLRSALAAGGLTAAAAGLAPRYSLLISAVTKAAPGRAIALYGYGNGELINMFQSLVVGADRDRYRKVDAMEERNRPSALLAPNGTGVLLGDDCGATRDLVLVDLTTDKRRSIPLGDPVIELIR
jgi:hypothetical protein